MYIPIFHLAKYLSLYITTEMVKMHSSTSYKKIVILIGVKGQFVNT